jgi:hypothetical protein
MFLYASLCGGPSHRPPSARRALEIPHDDEIGIAISAHLARGVRGSATANRSS